MLMQAFSILPPKELLVVALILEGPTIPNLFSHISRFYLRSPTAGQMAAMYQDVYTICLFLARWRQAEAGTTSTNPNRRHSYKNYYHNRWHSNAYYAQWYYNDERFWLPSELGTNNQTTDRVSFHSSSGTLFLIHCDKSEQTTRRKPLTLFLLFLVFFHINSLHLHQVLDIHTLYTLKTCFVMAPILTQNLSLWNIAYNMIRTL